MSRIIRIIWCNARTLDFFKEQKIPRFNDWYAKLFQQYQDGNYAEGLAVAQREGDRYIQHQPVIHHYRACMHAMLGDGDSALAELQAASDQGIWYSDLYWDDTDFDKIREHPTYVALRKLSEQRFAEARAITRPELNVITPEGAESADTLPLLIALHGNNTNAPRQSHNWRPAASQGWLLGLAQSSQIIGPEVYAWSDMDKTTPEIAAHYSALTRAYAVDPARVVLGGFSMGGEASICMALTGAVPARGFVAVAFGGPWTQESPEEVDRLVPAAVKRGVRGYFVLGKDDNGYEQQQAVIERLRGGGLTVEVEEHDGMAHAFPDDFGARLGEILAWVIAAEQMQPA